MATAFERAQEIVAKQLASFRLGLDSPDPFSYTEHEALCAGHAPADSRIHLIWE